MSFESDNNCLDVNTVIRSIKNAVLKEYLCLKRPKLLTNQVSNNFPVPERLQKFKYIDVDAISTDTCNSSHEDVKCSSKPFFSENIRFSNQSSFENCLTMAPSDDYQISTNESRDFVEEFDAKYQIFEESPISLDEVSINAKQSEAGLSLDDHYSRFLPGGDKKSKAIIAQLAIFEQNVFGEMGNSSLSVEKYQTFLNRLKIVLLVLMADWSVVAKYQTCNHITACQILSTCILSNIPKRIVLDAFKSFDDENFKMIKIRQLKKTKAYLNIQLMVKGIMA